MSSGSLRGFRPWLVCCSCCGLLVLLLFCVGLVAFPFEVVVRDVGKVVILFLMEGYVPYVGVLRGFPQIFLELHFFAIVVHLTCWLICRRRRCNFRLGLVAISPKA